MKVFILVDDQNIIRCVASHESNLHPDKLITMKKYVTDLPCIAGDEYNPSNGKVTKRPENYPEPSKEEKLRALNVKLLNNISDLCDFSLEMYNIGKLKGLWIEADFDPDIMSKVKTIKDVTDQTKNL